MYDIGDMVEWQCGENLVMIRWCDLLYLEVLGYDVVVRDYYGFG